MPAASTRVTRREIAGWAFYDFANSAFTTVVITVVGGVWFVGTIAGGAAWANTAWATALAASQLLAIVLGPSLGAWADATQRRRQLLLWTMAGCVTSTLGFALAGLAGAAWALGTVLAGNLCFALGENFCASFLPHLAPPDRQGRLSGFGWSFGYAGGLVSLGFCLAILQGTDLGVPAAVAATAGFMALATLPTALWLREPAPSRTKVSSPAPAKWRHPAVLWRDFSARPGLPGFLTAFTLYMAGLNIVVVFAAIFGAQVLGLTMAENLTLFLLLQVGSAAGALLAGLAQDRVGSVNTLTATLLLWLAVCLAAFFVRDKSAFFFVGNAAGLAMGGIQAASRAVVARLSPPDQSAEYFGFWGVAGRLAATGGPLLAGLAADLAGTSTVVLLAGCFFAAGLGVLRYNSARSQAAI